jgi:ribose transport system substrate-binding protein
MKRVLTLGFVFLMAWSLTGFLWANGSRESKAGFEYRKVVNYTEAIALESMAATKMNTLDYTQGDVPVIAYMPPAKEFNYYMAIGKGIEDICGKSGAEYFMLAPESGSDINGQMGMIQDAIIRDVDAIILSTHDEQAAAPLVKQAVEKGIMVIIVNSDIRNFPSPIHGVVGYSQRKGTEKLGQYAIDNYGAGHVKVGLIEGMPGYHSTERIGGFVDAIKGNDSFEIVASLSGNWNVEGGNMAAMDIIQGQPQVTMLMAANDYMIMGAQKSVEGLGRKDIVLLGNDGDTACLEEIAKGSIHATVNTTPFVMGQVAMQMVLDGLYGKFTGGFVEIPTVIVDKDNVLGFLKEPDKLYPKPSKVY